MNTDTELQHKMALDLYRQQMFLQLADPFQKLMPVPAPINYNYPNVNLLPPVLHGVQVRLENADMWQDFHKLGTEMIITKSGRRMFPSLRTAFVGLEPDAQYSVMIEMVPIGDCRFKYSGAHWVPAGGAEPQSNNRFYLHPDSPALGTHWMQQPVLFNKIKLTNNTLDNHGHVVLASMHKYVPRIYVIKASDPAHLPFSPQQSFCFPETEFIAVTAYQNDRITRLKIDNNPFAKGFRESGQSRCKRKSEASPDSSRRSDDDASDSDNTNSNDSTKRARTSSSGLSEDTENGNSSGCISSPSHSIEEEIDVGEEENFSQHTYNGSNTQQDLPQRFHDQCKLNFYHQMCYSRNYSDMIAMFMSPAAVLPIAATHFVDNMLLRQHEHPQRQQATEQVVSSCSRPTSLSPISINSLSPSQSNSSLSPSALNQRKNTFSINAILGE